MRPPPPLATRGKYKCICGLEEAWEVLLRDVGALHVNRGKCFRSLSTMPKIGRNKSNVKQGRKREREEWGSFKTPKCAI
jgi:hypothetical protein